MWLFGLCVAVAQQSCLAGGGRDGEQEQEVISVTRQTAVQLKQHRRSACSLGPEPKAILSLESQDYLELNLSESAAKSHQLATHAQQCSSS